MPRTAAFAPVLALCAGLALADGGGVAELRARHAAAPGDNEVTAELARTLARDRQYADAESLYRDLAAREPGNADYLLGLGQVLLWQDRAEDALPWLERAVELSPGYVDAQAALAQAQAAHATPRDDAGTPAPAGAHAFASLGHRIEYVTGEDEDWHDTRLELGYAPALHTAISAFARKSERFGLDDETYGVAANYPVLDGTHLRAEAAFSPDHRVLPASDLHFQVGQDIGAGFGVLAGIRRVEYTESLVHVGDFTLERYQGSFRAAYTAYPAHSDVAGDTLSHRVQVSWFAPGGSQVNAAFSTGTEAEKPLDATTVLKSDIDAISFWGRIRLTPALGLTWAADYTAVDLPAGRDSKRKGFNLGLEYDY